MSDDLFQDCQYYTFTLTRRAFLSSSLACSALILPLPKDIIFLDQEAYAKVRKIPVNQRAVAKAISDYRTQFGFNPVLYDPKLYPVAQDMADHIAKIGKLKTRKHSVSGLSKRMRKFRYAHTAAAENLGAGYKKFSDCFEGWKRSPGHNANLKSPRVTHFALARSRNDETRYKHYWALILSRKS